MVAHRLKIVIPEDHRVIVQVPEEVPAGPAELVVLVAPPAEADVEGEPAEVPKDEAERRFKALAAELASDPRPFRDLSLEERRARLQKVMGIGRDLFSTTEDLALRKQEEIDLEERRLGR